MGSYSFFDLGVPIFATQAFQCAGQPGRAVPRPADDLPQCDNGGSGGINTVINGVGGSSTAANPDTPVDVLSYP